MVYSNRSLAAAVLPALHEAFSGWYRSASIPATDDLHSCADALNTTVLGQENSVTNVLCVLGNPQKHGLSPKSSNCL